MTDFTAELEDLLGLGPPPLESLPDNDCVVYGAGNIGRRLAATLEESGRPVRAFVDMRVTGEIDGRPVFSPQSREARRLALDGLTAVIGVFNYTADPWPIWTLLRELGFRRVVTFHELHDHFALAPHFWLTTRRHVIDHGERVRAAWSLLDDDTSRRIYLELVRLRLTGDLRLLREPTWGQQYLPEDLPRPMTPLRFVDGGAFTGDTIEFLAAKGLAFAAAAAFEPDPANFKLLRESASRRRGTLGDVTLWPCGLGNSTRIATFRSGQGAASAVAVDGDVHVQLVALDEVMPSFSPTYIKLDIEGFELDALRGGAETIRQHQPAVAACVYHCPDHLWEIPLYLRALLPKHRIALRYHAYQAFEVVAYALPVA